MLSVIIPVYNVEKYLGECLESLVNQSYSNIEIIVINDGSSDNSQNIIDQFQMKNKKIICIKQENRGISAARNAGISVAKGEYITFLDSDDWIEKDMYKKMLAQMIKHNADIVACGVYDNYKDKQVPSLVLKDEVLNNINEDKEAFLLAHALKEASVVWNKIYKKQIILENNLFFTDRKTILQEDFLFNFKYYLNVATSVNISDLFVHYRVRKSSITKKKINDITEFNLRLIDYMDDYMVERGYTNQLDRYISQKAYLMFNISTYNTNNGFLKEIKNSIISFSNNKFYSRALPSKLNSLSFKSIIQYIIDMLVYLKFYNFATLIQWTKIKLYKLRKNRIIHGYFE